jgi:hypothetical protein
MLRRVASREDRVLLRMFALAALVSMLVAAMSSCSAGDDPPDPAALGALERLASDRTTGAIRDAARRAADTGDSRFVPYLVDLLRVEVDDARVAELTGALAHLTGVTPIGERVDDHVAFGSWLLDRPGVVPPPSYPEWKGRVYADLAPEFEDLLSPLPPRLAAEIQWGGVRFDGIDAIDTPPLVSPAGAGYLDVTDIVYGAVVDATARAYPRRILDVHELSNDVLGGEPVVLANCTLCRSAVLFRSTVAGRQLEFVTSGLLLDSNKIMVDLETRSLWRQLTGTAIAGPLEGLQLESLLLTTTTWGEWRDLHPATLVVDLPEQRGPELAIGAVTYDEGDAYRAYYRSEDLWFPARSAPGGEPKVEVVGIVRNGDSLGVELPAITAEGPTVVEVGGERVTVVPTAGAGARVFAGALDDADIEGITDEALELSDGRSLPRIESTTAFWFAWSATHPRSARWP